MSVTNTVETRLSADAAGYISGVKASIDELEKFIKTNQKAGAAVKKGGFDQGAKGLANFIKQNRTLGDVAKNAAAAIAETSAAAALGVAGFTAIAGAAALAAHQAITFADELNKVSLRTGAAVESLSTLGFAAEQSEASFGDLQIGLRNLARTAVAAANGNKQAAQAFRQLGVEVKDANGNIREVDALFRDVARGVAGLGSNAQKTAVAAQLLGRLSGPALVPLLKEGEDGIRALEERARSLGGEISTGFVKQADAFGDRLKELKTVTIGLGQAIATAVLPALDTLVLGFVNALAPGTDLKFLAASMGTQLAILANKFLFGAAAIAGFFARLTRNDVALKKAQAELARTSKAIANAETEFDKLFEPRTQKLQPTPDEIEDTKTAIESLVEEFENLGNKGIAPVIALAKEFADSALGALDPRLDALIARLQTLAKTSQEAGRALAEVLQVRQDAIAQGLQEGGRVQGPATATGEGPTAARTDAAQFFLPQATSLGFAEEVPLIEDAAGFAEQLRAAILGTDLAADALNSTLAKGNGILAGLTALAFGLGDAIADVFEGNKQALSEFFSQLLKQLGRAIIRATILQALLGFLGGGFSLGKILKSVQSQLGFGAIGFQDRESSIMGRASQARGLSAGLAGPALAAAPAAGANSSLVVQIHEPGPLTWSEITDRKVLPRLRERQRRLNEQAL
jgi:primosomal protein N''